MFRVSCDQRCLAHRVEPAAGLRHVRGDRGEVDDRTAAGRPQVRAAASAQHDGTDDVDVERGVPVSTRGGEALVEVRAREVDEPVDARRSAPRRRRRAASSASSSVMSVAEKSTRSPSSAASASPGATSTSAIPTHMPWSCSSRTTARPISVEPPVTIAVLPSSLPIAATITATPRRDHSSRRWYAHGR